MSLGNNCHICLVLLFFDFIAYKTKAYIQSTVSGFCLVAVTRCLVPTRQKDTKKTPPCLVLPALKAAPLLAFRNDQTKRQTRQLFWVTPEKGAQGRAI